MLHAPVVNKTTALTLGHKVFGVDSTSQAICLCQRFLVANLVIKAHDLVRIPRKSFSGRSYGCSRSLDSLLGGGHACAVA